MSLTDTVLTLFSVEITWMHLLIALAVLAAHYILLELVLEPKPRIRIRKALIRAVRTGAQRYTDALKFMFAEACLMLVGLVPAAYLLIEGLQMLLGRIPSLFLQEPITQILAAATHLLFLTVVIPARMNAAEVMQDSLSGRSLFSWKILDYSELRKKVICGLKRMLLWPLWTIPTIVFGFSVYRQIKGENDMDAFTLLQQYKEFGGGDVKISFLYSMLIITGLILIMMIGAGHHSGVRHGLALGNPKMVNGHHGKLVLGWLCATLVFMLPFWIALAIVLAPIVRVLLTDLNSIYLHTANLPGSRTMLMIIGAGTLLSIPLIPFRSLMIAAMVRQLKDQEENAAP